MFKSLKVTHNPFLQFFQALVPILFQTTTFSSTLINFKKAQQHCNPSLSKMPNIKLLFEGVVSFFNIIIAVVSLQSITKIDRRTIVNIRLSDP